jgi:hypothetical protein
MCARPELTCHGLDILPREPGRSDLRQKNIAFRVVGADGLAVFEGTGSGDAPRGLRGLPTLNLPTWCEPIQETLMGRA